MLVHACSCLFMLVHTCSYLLMLVHACSYLFILVHACSCLLKLFPPLIRLNPRMKPNAAISASMSDSLLVERFRSGERRAFEILAQRWQEPIFRFAWRYVHSADEAMDVTQNTFMKAWANISTLDDPGKFGAWLYRICRHQCLDHLKSGHKQRIVAMSGLGLAESDAAMDQSIPAPEGDGPHRQLETANETRCCTTRSTTSPKSRR